MAGAQRTRYESHQWDATEDDAECIVCGVTWQDCDDDCPGELPDYQEQIAVLTDRLALLEAVIDRTERVARDLRKYGGKYEDAADQVLEALGAALR